MGDPNNPERIYLTISPPGELDIAREIQRRADGQKDLEWQSFVNQTMTTAETGGKAMPTEGKPVTPPIESASEQVRNQAQASLDEPVAKKAINSAFKIMTGMTYDELQKSAEKGELPMSVAQKLYDPLSSLMEAAATQKAEASDLPKDITKHFGAIAALSSGMLFPVPGKKTDEAGKVTRAAAAGAKKALEASGLSIGDANINVARVDAAQTVKSTITRLNQLMAERLTGSRQTVTHAETVAAGQARGMTIEDALSLTDQELSLEGARTTQQALRDLHNKVATVIDDLRARAMKGDQAAADDLARSWMVAGEIGAKDEMIGSGAGRVLEARKIPSQAERAAFTAEEFATIRDKMAAEGVDGFEIARYLTQIQGRRNRMDFLTTVKNGYKNVNDAFHWLFLQSVLSSRATHYANLAGTGLMQVLHFPERYVAEWINRVFFQNPDGVQRGETWAAMRASGRGLSEGVQMLGKAIRTGEQPLGAGRIEARFDVTAKQFGLDPNTPTGHLFDVVGAVSPTRLMMGEDAVYKGFAYRTELAALALREALKRTTDPVELNRIAHQLEMHPTGEMQRLATEAAMLRTLNAELGALGSMVIKIRNGIPGGWVIAPFLQTPGNSYKWFHQRAPILSLASQQNWSDIMAGGATRDLAMSRMLLGSAVGGAIVYECLQGNITGGMPIGSNKNLNRDARMVGLDRYTINVGGEYYGYKRLDPVGTYIGAICTAVEIYSQLSPGDPDFKYEDFAIAAALAGSRVALDTPWLSGGSNVLAAINHPDTDSKKMLQGFARSVVPGAVRDVTRGGIPGVLDAYPEIRELDSLLDVIKADVTPWLVAPYLHPITGETVERPPGWGPDTVSPIFISRRRDDPVLMEIIRHKMNFNEPPKMAWGRQENDWSLDPTLGDPDGVKLTPGQYFTLKYLATTELRNGQGQTMHDAMAALIGTEQYRRAVGGPDGRKETMLKIIYHDFYARAMAKLRSENTELDDAIKAKREYKIRLGGTADSPNAVQPRVAPGLPAALDSMMRSLGR